MSLLSNLFLGGVLLSCCSFTNNIDRTAQPYAVAPKQFEVEYNANLKAVGVFETKYRFDYGQKFIYATWDSRVGNIEDVMDDRDYSFDVHKLKNNSSSELLVINSKSDLDKLNNPGNYIDGHSSNTPYALIPVDGAYNGLISTLDYQTYEIKKCMNWTLDENEEYSNMAPLNLAADLIKANSKPVATECDTRPVISGYQGVYLSNVNTPITVQTVKSQLKAHDDLDGDLTQQIQIENDTFTGNENKVGEYPVTFSVADKAGNKASITIKIQVIDADLPVFSGPNTFTSPLSNKLTVESIKSQIKVTDNYDKAIQYTVVTDEFTGKESIPGTYKMKFKAEDSSHNIAYKEVTITVKDDVLPTISGNASYRTSYDKKISLDTIKNSLTVKDNVDKLTNANLVLVEDTYTANYSKSGTYHVKFKVTDTAKNESEIFDITITVVDEKMPTFEVSDFIINLDHFTTLSREQILELLKNSGQIDMKRITNPDEQIKMVTDEYNGSEQAGTYNMKLSVKYDDGETKEINFKINKMQNPSINNVTLPWYTVFWNWCVNSIFEPIANFFKSIGKAILNIFK